MRRQFSPLLIHVPRLPTVTARSPTESTGRYVAAGVTENSSPIGAPTSAEETVNSSSTPVSTVRQRSGATGRAEVAAPVSSSATACLQYAPTGHEHSAHTGPLSSNPTSVRYTRLPEPRTEPASTQSSAHHVASRTRPWWAYCTPRATVGLSKSASRSSRLIATPFRKAMGAGYGHAPTRSRSHAGQVAHAATPQLPCEICVTAGTFVSDGLRRDRLQMARGVSSACGDAFTSISSYAQAARAKKVRVNAVGICRHLI